MKTLFIGNSHVVAIKDGLDLAPSLFSEAPTFMVAPGSELRLDISDGVIHPKAQRVQMVSPEGDDVRSVTIADFDAIVIVGMGVTPLQSARSFNRFAIYPHATSGKRLLSRAAFTASLDGVVRKTAAVTLAQQLRGFTQAPILLVPQPVPPVRLREIVPENEWHKTVVDRWHIMFDDDLGLFFYDAYEKAMHEMARDVRVVFVNQPAETRTPVFSKNEFKAQFEVNFLRNKPNRVKPVEDLTHLNAAYGAIMVREMERALAS